MSARQFRDFRAASLYGAPCGEARPVQERLMHVLPEKELYEYLCADCGHSVGTREVSAAEQVMRREAARGPGGAQVRIL
jgi:hypothetical protein